MIILEKIEASFSKYSLLSGLTKGWPKDHHSTKISLFISGHFAAAARGQDYVGPGKWDYEVGASLGG